MNDVLTAKAQWMTRNRSLERDGVVVGHVEFASLFSMRCTVTLDGASVTCVPRLLGGYDAHDPDQRPVLGAHFGLFGLGGSVSAAEYGEWPMHQGWWTTLFRVGPKTRPLAELRKPSLWSRSLQATFAEELATPVRAALLGLACIRVERRKRQANQSSGS